MTLWPMLQHYWRDVLEILILAVAIYYTWRFFRGTRGAKVLTGIAVVFLAVVMLTRVFELEVIGWLFTNLSAFLIFGVIFQPELRRALAALGSHPVFASVTQSRETVELLSEITFELANRQLGALIAIERDTNIDTFAESGVAIDCQLSPELIVSIFFPKTPLHDGAIIIRNERIVAAACMLPVSQRIDLDRKLGTRHRAALGLSEESDAVVIVTSEETGIVSICHRGTIERDFDPESFAHRLGELLLLDKHENAQKSLHAAPGREDRFTRAGHRPVEHDQKNRDDHLAF
jgi:diadenylate cyclase